MSYEYVKNYRQRQKENIIYVMGGKCACCGYNKCNKALELHHLNPKEKEFTLSQNTNRAWKYVVAELPKTVMVCANCHREIHDGLIKKEVLVSNFDATKANEITEQIEKSKTAKINYCIDCGKPIDAKATRCIKCAAKFRQIVERPTRAQLKEDIRNMPMTQVGKKYGVSDNSIRKWCSKMGLPNKVTKIKSYTDKEWENI